MPIKNGKYKSALSFFARECTFTVFMEKTCYYNKLIMVRGYGIIIKELTEING